MENIFSNVGLSIQEKKAKIRTIIKTLKDTHLEDFKLKDANAVFARIEALPEFTKAQTILMYWSLADELPTHHFVNKWSVSKQILLPKVVGNEIEIKQFISMDTMKKGDYGILEPSTASNFEGEIDIIIVPGVAFDKQKNRLGRGKGYYDRLLSKTFALKIGVGFDFQMLDNLPFNEEDIKMDVVISQTQTIN